MVPHKRHGTALLLKRGAAMWLHLGAVNELQELCRVREAAVPNLGRVLPSWMAAGRPNDYAGEKGRAVGHKVTRSLTRCEFWALRAQTFAQLSPVQPPL